MLELGARIYYRLIICWACGWRHWSSTAEQAEGGQAMPTVHRRPDTGEPCLHPDCWEHRTFEAVYEGPGCHPRQEAKDRLIEERPVEAA